MKETYLSCIETPRRILKQSFEYLELKGKPVKTFEPNIEDSEVLTVLKSIEPLIENEGSIPHAQAKLKDYPALQKFLGRHMTDGLYLLQFRKCNDESCCKIRGKQIIHSFFL